MDTLCININKSSELKKFDYASYKIQVLAYSKEDNHVIAKCLGAKFYYDLNEMLSA